MMGRGGQLLLPSLFPTFLTFKLLLGQKPPVEPVRRKPSRNSITSGPGYCSISFLGDKITLQSSHLSLYWKRFSSGNV